MLDTYDGIKTLGLLCGILALAIFIYLTLSE
jgi:hypothetical protein